RFRGRDADEHILRRPENADRPGPGQCLDAGDAVEGQMDQRARAWFGTWTGLGQALRDRAGGEVSAQVVRVVLVELRQSARADSPARRARRSRARWTGGREPGAARGPVWARRSEIVRAVKCPRRQPA